jgi:hypothetical protein
MTLPRAHGAQEGADKGIRCSTMALEWIENYQAMVGTDGTSLIVLGRSDYHAQNGNREYFINHDQAAQMWALDILVAGHPVVASQSFGSVNAAKQHAEKHDRDARRAEGYDYAQLRGAGAPEQAAFGDRWADKYSVEGRAVADAWADFNSES